MSDKVVVDMSGADQPSRDAMRVQLLDALTSVAHDLRGPLGELSIMLDEIEPLAASGVCDQVGSCVEPARRNAEFARGGLSPRRLKLVQSHMMSNLDRDVDLQELAVVADLSPYHLCRAFKQSAGLPPHGWLIRQRMIRARELMAAHPNMGLTEIALSVGYASQTTFGVAFKRATGLTPGQWRRKKTEWRVDRDPTTRQPAQLVSPEPAGQP